jgi:hypothetical protein
MKTRLLIIIVLASISFIPNVSAMCAAEALEWWEPCNDTGEFSDGVYVRYALLIPILIMLILLSGFVLLVYRRKRK